MRPSRSLTPNIVVIGSLYLDINAAGFPFETGLRAEEEIVGGPYQAIPGGSAVNFSRVVRRLGLQPILIGKTGQDAVGQSLRKILLQQGIELDLLQSEEVVTNVGINVVNQAGRRVMIVLGTANQTLTPQEVSERFKQHLARATYLYLGGYFKLKSLASFYPTLIQQAQQAGLRVILDHGRLTNVVSKREVRSLRSLLRQLSRTDYYLPAEEEFLEVFGAKSLEQGLALFRRSSSATIVVKQAQRGATGLQGQESIQRPAYSVKPQETAGAGDAFNAGFIKAQAEARSFEESLRFANATAAVKISSQDLPTLAQIEELLRVSA